MGVSCARFCGEVPLRGDRVLLLRSVGIDAHGLSPLSLDSSSWLGSAPKLFLEHRPLTCRSWVGHVFLSRHPAPRAPLPHSGPRVSTVRYQFTGSLVTSGGSDRAVSPNRSADQVDEYRLATYSLRLPPIDLI